MYSRVRIAPVSGKQQGAETLDWDCAEVCACVCVCVCVHRCLQEHLDDNAMSKECKDETVKDMNRMAGDYRLNWRLNHACEGEINRMCANVCSNSGGNGQLCGGLVLQCLQV